MYSKVFQSVRRHNCKSRSFPWPDHGKPFPYQKKIFHLVGELFLLEDEQKFPWLTIVSAITIHIRRRIIVAQSRHFCIQHDENITLTWLTSALSTIASRPAGCWRGLAGVCCFIWVHNESRSAKHVTGIAVFRSVVVACAIGIVVTRLGIRDVR